MQKSQTLKPEALLRNGTYRIEHVLGQGGFGITYLATDLNLDRKVAVKEFFPKDYCDRNSDTSHVTLGTQSTSEFVDKLKAKFLKEARNIAKFDNPGIIKIHAAFEQNNTAYYVMDYIEGESLADMVKANGPLPESKALEYIEKVGNALEYVHGHKINHLDVKPGNIMVRKADDIPILIDFGLSKQYDASGHQTSTTPTGISHGFAPMEQYHEGGVKEFSPQTDLYSLAATLYYLLTGGVPPQAPKLIEEELSFPSSVDPKLVGIISKAMSSSRKNRHESVAEFLSQLRKIGSFEEQSTFMGIQQKDNRNGNLDNPKSSPFYKSKKFIVSIAVILLLIVVSLCGVALFFDTQSNETQNESVLSETDLLKLAEDGDIEAQYKLGNFYSKFSDSDENFFNNDSTANYEESIKWYRLAANHGHADAQYRLGYLYEHALGVDYDYAEACKWYQKSADQGNPQAECRIAMMYASEKNYKAAFPWLHKSAKQNNAKAQFSIGLMYKNGLGVEKNSAEALKWIRKAAENNSADACFELAWIYQDGNLVEHDNEEYIKWIGKYADLSGQQYAFALEYEHGNEYLKQNYTEAYKWYDKAAEKGDSRAMYKLGVFFYNGLGVAKDVSKAKTYWEKAASKGDEDAKDCLKKYFSK